MKRITTKMIREAFDKIDMLPGRLMFMLPDIRTCCGIGAIVSFEGMRLDSQKSNEYSDTMIKMGYDFDYLWGFIKGWDTLDPEYLIGHINYSELDGFNDGVAAAKEMGLLCAA